MRFCEVMAYYDYKVSNIVKELKVARDTVNAWKDHNHIPFRMQCVIEIMTDGKLKANRDDFKGE